jgi:hypothetical protein
MADLAVLVRNALGRSPLVGITGTSGVWTDVTPAGISLAVDVTGAPNYTGHVGGGSTASFGCIGMAADPYHAGVAYCGADNQGFWKTTNYGLTWFLVNDGKTGGILDGSLWSAAVAPSYLLVCNGYGTNLGVARSTDGGATFSQVVSGDIDAYVAVCAADPSRCLVTAHGPDAPSDPLWKWSTNSGVTWSDVNGSNTAAGGPGHANLGTWLDAQTFICQGPLGVWQGKESGGTWTWTKVLDSESNHGGTQMFRDTVNSQFYVGIALVGPGRQQIHRTTFASRGDSWTLVSDILGGGAYGSSTVFGTIATIYSQGNYATHTTTGSPYGPLAEHAALPAGTSWSTDTLPAGIHNGAHSAAVLTDGSRWCLLTANDNAGIWRYIE